MKTWDRFKVALFLTIALTLYLSMNLFLFWRLTDLFNLAWTLQLLLILAVSALAFPVTCILERILDERVTRKIYTLGAVWFGTQFILFCTATVLGTIGPLVGLSGKLTGWGVISVAATLTVYSLWNATQLWIREITIPLKGLHEEKTIVHLSDIHVGTIRNHAYLQKIVHMTNRLKPDMVLITGDLFDGSGRVRPDTVRALNDFAAPTFFTTGNHEHYEGIGSVMHLLKNTNARVLRNEAVHEQGIRIIGIDNPPGPFHTAHEHLPKLLVGPEKPTILMYHLPSGLDDAAKLGVGLQLSGHTHNGQIFPFNFVVKVFFPYIKGLYRYKGMYLYVSPGTGTWGPPMRLGSRCEITKIKLVPTEPTPSVA